MERQLHLIPGATVYAAGGEKVGTITTWGRNYLVVEGFSFPQITTSLDRSRILNRGGGLSECHQG